MAETPIVSDQMNSGTQPAQQKAAGKRAKYSQSAKVKTRKTFAKIMSNPKMKTNGKTSQTALKDQAC